MARINKSIKNIQNTKKFPLLSRSFFGYGFTFLLIFLNGSVIFSGNRLLLTIFLVFGLVIFIIQKKKVEKYLFYTLGFLVLITIVQSMNFSFFSLNTTLGTFVRFLVPYFFVRIINQKFPQFYVSVLYFFTLISLLLYSFSIISPQFYDFLLTVPRLVGTQKYGDGTCFLIYTVETGTRMGFLRNSGPFWEPGAFSGFLTLAILFNISITSKLWNKKNLIFIIAIITTFSTAGYISLLLIIFSYYFVLIKRKSSFIIMPLVIIVSWYVYFSFDFLNERISYEIELSEESDRAYTGRIGSGLKDLKDIIENPFFGKGRNVATRFDKFDEADILTYHRTNGVTDFMVKYGLLFALFYFFCIYKSMKAVCLYYGFNSRFAIFILLIILTIGFSQTFFQGSLFISLIYLHIVLKKRTSLAFKPTLNEKNIYSNSHT